MTDEKELPVWLRTAMSGGDVLVVRRNTQVMRDTMAEHHEMLTKLGIREAVTVDRARMQIRFLSGGRITYIPAFSADERVRGMQVDLIDDVGWLDDHTRALIQKRPVLS